VQYEELIWSEGKHGVFLALIIGKLYFVNIGRPHFHYGGYRAPDQPAFGQILKQSNYRVHVDVGLGRSSSFMAT